MRRVFLAFLACAALLGLPLVSHAEGSVGVYCWEMQPFIDVWCLDIEDQSGFAFGLVGWNHVEGMYRNPVHGAAIYDDNQRVYSLQLSTRSPDMFLTAFVNVNMNPSTLSGPWMDSFGLSGTFVYLGGGPRGSENIKPEDAPSYFQRP